MTGAVTRQHSSVKRYRALARTSANSGLERELLLDGVHLLAEARASRLPIDTAAFDRDALNDPAARLLAEQLRAAGSEVLIVSRNVLEAMSPVKTPSGVVAIARRSLATLPAALAGAAPLVLLAHDVQDPGNVGALVRTAEASGATALVACGSTADPFGWKALRGSMGSAFRLVIARADIADVLSECRTRGIALVALTARTKQSVFASDFQPATAILLGSEGAGLPASLLDAADQQVSIPMKAPVESLNVAVAAALVMYEAFRQRAGTR
jgi:TrmH family RNA methyltransferase